jgi:hypothetical protein
LRAGAFAAVRGADFVAGPFVAAAFVAVAFVAAVFVAAGFFGAGLAAADRAVVFFTAAARAGFAGAAALPREGVAAARAGVFARGCAFAVFARVPWVGLLLAMSKAYPVTRRSRVIA